MKKTLLAFAVVAFSSMANAAPVTYSVDDSHTFPRFSYNHQGLSFQVSRFDKTSGVIVYDREKREASVDISIDMTSVSTGSKIFDQHIQGPDFLDTVNHPRATFMSKDIVFDGDKPAFIQGKLTIKGISKDVTLTVLDFSAKPHPMNKKEAIGANAYTVVKRSDFNMGKYTPNVGDEVRIDISLEAIQKP